MGTQIRTSESHPIYVDWLPNIGAGAIGLTIAPGKKTFSLSGNVRWERDLIADLDRLVDPFGITVVACLIEDHELVSLGIEDYVDEAEQRFETVLRFPIQDGATPPSPAAIHPLIERIDRAARGSETVLIHCAGGLGRAGTVAGCLLVERGLTAAEALDVLHQARSQNCPENAGQEAFIAAYEAFRAPDPQALGAVFGAAIGDAMGAPSEFMSLDEIRDTFGPRGVVGYEAYRILHGQQVAPFTDDTQMAMVVLETLGRAVRSDWNLDATMRVLAEEFVRWANHPIGGHRAPGNACLSGCAQLERGVHWSEAGGATAGGCGSVMRAYPFGLVFAGNLEQAEEWAVAHSKLTHRDPIALAACAAMAVGTALALRDEAVETVVLTMVEAAARYCPTTAAMIRRAADEAAAGVPTADVMDRLRAWAAHEAIAAGVFLFVRHPEDPAAAILAGANTPGDSDSIATIGGALVGARCGIARIPSGWIKPIERYDELWALARHARSPERSDVSAVADSGSTTHPSGSTQQRKPIS